MSQAEDRSSPGRKTGRFKLIVPCEIKGSQGSSKLPLRDISLEGCRVISTEAHGVGDSVHLTIRLPSPVEIPAHVRWVDRDAGKELYILGCEFAHTPESRKSLRDALQGMASAIDSAAKRVK
ncbi:MAG TPA: PilZ domain-containing protein [Planctomycetota bacterium]|nr:PilZ domain-containing protein [Planctomycetota bacterium]